MTKSVVFSTSNYGKYEYAKIVCEDYGIDVIQKILNVDEIQGNFPEKVAIDKAKRAYEMVKSPVVITDDSWSFPGLRGFPGVYTSSINQWFTADDYLRLTSRLSDRRAIYTQYLVYANGEKTKVFEFNSEGTLLKQARGKSKYPNLMIITMNGDDGKSVAEVHADKASRLTHDSALIWHDFAKWFQNNQ